MMGMLGRYLRDHYDLLRFYPIYRRHREQTMVWPSVYLRNLQLASRYEPVRGCVVECGVWRGGMIAGIAEVLGPGRKYWLFDSFEGLPSVRERDGPAAAAWQANPNARLTTIIAAPRWPKQKLR